MPCYSCNFCGACGKYESELFLLSRPAVLQCPRCGADVDMATGRCGDCGFRRFDPPGTSQGRERGPQQGPSEGKEE